MLLCHEAMSNAPNNSGCPELRVISKVTKSCNSKVFSAAFHAYCLACREALLCLVNRHPRVITGL